MIIENHTHMYSHISDSYFEFKRITPRQFGPYILIKNHFKYTSPERLREYNLIVSEPYVYDIEDFDCKTYEYMILGLIVKRKTKI